MKLTPPCHEERERSWGILFHVCVLDAVAVVWTDTFVFARRGQSGAFALPWISGCTKLGQAGRTARRQYACATQTLAPPLLFGPLKNVSILVSFLWPSAAPGDGASLAFKIFTSTAKEKYLRARTQNCPGKNYLQVFSSFYVWWMVPIVAVTRHKYV